MRTMHDFFDRFADSARDLKVRDTLMINNRLLDIAAGVAFGCAAMWLLSKLGGGSPLSKGAGSMSERANFNGRSRTRISDGAEEPDFASDR